MKIPIGDNVCCAADLFEYDESKKLNLRQFFLQHKNEFPMLIVIIGGHYGETKYDCYDNLQVLRVHCYTSQPRVVADDARLDPRHQMGYLTIPEDTLIKFRLVQGHTKLGNLQPLSELLQENDRLPLLVQMACHSRYPVKIGSTKYHAKDLGNITIKERYQEHFFLMNAIDTIELDMNKLTCMACLSEDLDAAPITGFKYGTKAEFDEFCRKLSKDAAESGESYDIHQGDDAFGEYSSDEIRSLLKISDFATGLLSEDQEADEFVTEDDNYEEIPPIVPSRNPIHDQKAKEDHQDIEQAKQLNHKPAHGQTPIAHSPKNPDSPKTQHKETKSAFGFFKKKYHSVKEKENHTSNELEKSVENLYTSESRDQNIRQPQLPPKVPPHVKKISDQTDDTYSYADMKAGYVTVSVASKPYQNTQIGRATVKPMQVMNKEGGDSNNLGMGIKNKTGEEDIEALCDKTQTTQSKINRPEDFKNRDLKTDKHYKKTNEGEGHPAEQSDDSLEEYGSFEFTQGIKQGGAKPTPTSPEHECKPVRDKDKQSSADIKDDNEEFTNLNVKSMTISEISEHLKTLKLGQYAEVFEENQIDGVILATLSVEDLQNELGMRKLEAIRLNKFATTGHIPR